MKQEKRARFRNLLVDIIWWDCNRRDDGAVLNRTAFLSDAIFGTASQQTLGAENPHC